MCSINMIFNFGSMPVARSAKFKTRPRYSRVALRYTEKRAGIHLPFL
jgi:hypothetical protein